MTSLLYLANDIMQNTRKESGGYIPEFMRVVPAAMNKVLKNADDSGWKVVKRMVCRTCMFLICSFIFVV
jgi:regulator of Ty1 transposition protein 103